MHRLHVDGLKEPFEPVWPGLPAPPANPTIWDSWTPGPPEAGFRGVLNKVVMRGS